MTPDGASPALAPTAERASRLLMDAYPPRPVTLVDGHGVWVRDSDGRELIDLVAGIAVNVLGHGHPALREALSAQAQRLIHTSNLYYSEPQLELAEALIRTSFPGRVFFCNSGAEATEAAIKLARKWGKRARGGAANIVCMEGAFHGRTAAALAATANRRYQEPFQPLPGGFTHVAYNDVDALAAAVDDRACAVMLEPIQGESGVHPLDTGVLHRIRELCDARDVLLILDEVQTGMGRTGRWWAHQHDGVAPDVMTIAKGLGGGVPIGAVVAAPRADVFEPGDHGSTFGGGPLACAAGVAVMRAIDDEGLVANAASVGDHLTGSLHALADELPIAEVRGRGLMIGVGLSEDVAPQLASAALREGLIVNAIGARTLRLVPPLVITRAEVDESLHRLRAAFTRVAAVAV